MKKFKESNFFVMPDTPRKLLFYVFAHYKQKENDAQKASDSNVANTNHL